jgi:ankyrin repeat protein
MVFVLSMAVVAVTAGNDLRLVNAAKDQEQALVRALLDQRADVNAAEPDGTTALAWAAHWDDLQMADLLIAAGADVDAANDYGVTPLSLACTNGSATMVARLLKSGANPNLARRTGVTPLMACARTGSLEAVPALLTRGAKVNAKELRGGQTALMWAVAAGHPAVARMLVEHGADVQARTDPPAGFTPPKYKLAGVYTDLEITWKGGFTPLMFAAQQGNVDSARILLEAGADVNARTPDYGSALVVAAASANEALALFLLEHGADPNVADNYGITPLHYVVQQGLTELRFFLTDESYRPLPRNQTELAKALLAHGANPDAQIKKSLVVYPAQTPGSAKMVGATPFFLAAIADDVDLMRILAAGHANPNLSASGNYWPLMAAAGGDRRPDRSQEEQRNALEAVKLLVMELGSDVQAVSAVGQTAMHAAAFTGADAIVEFLAEKGAKVDAKDRTGQTPWSMAVGISASDDGAGQYGYHPGTASLLVKLGATPWTEQEIGAFKNKKSVPYIKDISQKNSDPQK